MPQRLCAFSSIASNTGLRSPGEELMTPRTSTVAVCCSNASRVSLISRAFSIATTACVAKFCSRRDFGAGIAQGYATLRQIGFSERSGYTAIGTVCNLAARVCADAKDGQILVSSRIAEAVEAVARLEDLGNLELKGLRRPVAAFNVVQSTSPAEARPNLTVVASGPGT